MPDPTPEQETRARAEGILSGLSLYCGPYEVGVIAEALAVAERRGAETLLGDDSTLTVNILRAWERDRIERFCLHLLGDAAQNLFVEWHRRGAEAEREACAELLLDFMVADHRIPPDVERLLNNQLAKAQDAIRARSTKGEGE